MALLSWKLRSPSWQAGLEDLAPEIGKGLWQGAKWLSGRNLEIARTHSFFFIRSSNLLVDHQKSIKELPQKQRKAIARDNQLCHKNAWFNRLGTTICTFSLYIFSDFQDQISGKTDLFALSIELQCSSHKMKRLERLDKQTHRKSGTRQ